MKQEKSCGIVVFNQEKFLILQYDLGHWGFPKGGIEKDEEEKETALRELSEETGIKQIKFIPGFREKVRYNYKAANVIWDKIVIFFLGETQETEVKLSKEHKDFVWLNYREALEKITYDEDKEVLTSAFEHLKSHDKNLSDFF